MAGKSRNITDAAIKKTAANVDKYIDEMRRIVLRSIFDDIVNNSPIITGFYASNHRILEQNESFETIERREDAYEGEFLEDIEINRNKQLSKLDKMEGVSKVTIANPVSYASDVEARHGVYQKAITAGTQLAQSLLKKREI